MPETRLNFTMLCSPCKRQGKHTPLNIYAANVEDGKLVLKMTCPVCGESDVATVEFGPIKHGLPESTFAIPAPCHCGGRRQFVRASTLGSVKGIDTVTAITACTVCKTTGTAEISCNTLQPLATLKPTTGWTLHPGLTWEEAIQKVRETPGLRRLPTAQIEAIADLLVLNSPARPQIVVRRGDFKALGAAFRELRLRRKETVTQVAAAIGFSVPTVSLAERPARDTSLNVIQALAAHYHVDVVLIPKE